LGQSRKKLSLIVAEPAYRAPRIREPLIKPACEKAGQASGLLIQKAKITDHVV